MKARTRSGRTRSALLFVAAAAAGACGGAAPRDRTPLTLAAGTNPEAGDTSNAPAEGAALEDGGAERDRAAVAALTRMGEYLRSLRAFAVRAVATTDEILDIGQKIQLEKTIDLWVRRPDGLRASVESDRAKREYFYDGNTFTLYAPRLGYYAEFLAPKTIIELVDVAERRYGVEMPLVDLLRWGSEEGDAERLESALDLGPSRIAGVDTEHYAYRREDVDFQVWIERGERPLPRKLVITTTSEPAQPQYALTLAWNLDPRLSDGHFAFMAPEGANRIVFEVMKP